MVEPKKDPDVHRYFAAMQSMVGSIEKRPSVVFRDASAHGGRIIATTKSSLALQHAIDDADPAVVMASLTRCRGAAFSHGTFAWWIAYLTAGPVVFDAGMLDYARHGQCYSAKLGVSSDPCGPTSPRGYVASHLPPWWQPVGVGEEERLTEVPCRAELRGYAGA